MRKMNQADIAKTLTHDQLVKQLYISQLLLLVIAIFIGFFAFDDIRSIMSLFAFNWKWMIIAGVLGILVVAVDILLMRVLPAELIDDGGINNKIFQGMPIWKTIVTTLLIAIAEEVLFRGVIQTNYGLVVASLLFAVVHIRYLSKWYLFLNVIVLSLLIGLVYEWSGQHLLPVIVMHFVIDVLLGIYIGSRDYHKEGM